MVLKVGAMSPQYQPVCGLCEKRKFSGLRQTYESGALEGVPRSMYFNQWPDEFETPCPAAYAREMRPQFQQSGKERFTQQPRIEHLLDATLHQARGVLSLHDAFFGNLLWLVRCAGKQWEDRGRGAVAGGEGQESLSAGISWRSTRKYKQMWARQRGRCGCKRLQGRTDTVNKLPL